MQGVKLIYDNGLLELLRGASKGSLAKLLEALQRPPLRFYIRVNTLKAEPEDLIRAATKRGIELRADERLGYALWSDVKGPFKVTLADKVVVADHRSSESVYLGSDLYAPGVLRAMGIRKGDYVSVVTPEGIVVGAGRALMDGDEMMKLKRGLAISIEESVYVAPKVRSLPGFSDGLFYSQSYPSMWVAELAEPKESQIIVDMTAAPGGKVSHIAQLTGPKAKIYAIDRESKVGKLTDNLHRLGVTWVNVVGGDSRRASEILGLRELADLVILDPPCTNLGVIPKLYDRRSITDAINLSSYQFQFIKEAYNLLRPGGLLVYSTCTLTDVENEFNMIRAEALGFEIEIPSEVPRWASFNGLGLRFSPEDGVPGFFISLLRKRGRG